MTLNETKEFLIQLQMDRDDSIANTRALQLQIDQVIQDLVDWNKNHSQKGE